jgi:hypothetical protein
MARWTADELDRIGAADELELASTRSDGTLRKPVTMWVVRHGDELYVRSWRGRGSGWFRGVLDRHEGHVSAGGVEKDVALEETRDAEDEVDRGYRTKYDSYDSSIVDPMVAEPAQAATLRLVPK